MRVELREDEQGGATALVVLPRRLLPDAGPPGRPHPRSPSRRARPLLTLPGTIAEANGNTLPTRSRPAAAEGEHTGDAGGPRGDGAAAGTAEADAGTAGGAGVRAGGGAAPAPEPEAYPDGESRTDSRPRVDVEPLPHPEPARQSGGTTAHDDHEGSTEPARTPQGARAGGVRRDPGRPRQ